MENWLSMLKLKAGPINPNPGPILPRHEAAHEKLVINPSPLNEMMSVPMIRAAIYVKTKPVVLIAMSADISVLFIVILLILFGCILVEKYLLTSLRQMIIRDTLMPPPVDEAQPPIKKKHRSIILENVGQIS